VDPWSVVVLSSSVLWLSILLLPWQPWRTREILEPDAEAGRPDLSCVTVLIPARNEAGVIEETLTSARGQGPGLTIFVIDDQSSDSTGDIARGLGYPGVHVIAGQPLAAGWTGKLWALEQGRRLVDTPYLLLLDADIRLEQGILRALLSKAEQGFDLVSLMAELRMHDRWERLLLPAFIYFFRLLYPFRLANGSGRLVAAAAGGCVLLRQDALTAIDGFQSIRDQIIDDCALAGRFKNAGFRTWVGLTHGARSLRPYPGLGAVWDMVARTAFTQLRYSNILLLICTLALLLAFLAPFLGLLMDFTTLGFWSGFALVAMLISYLPTLHYYSIPKVWAASLPVAGLLYLAMTWASAWRYWRGERSRWKDRSYVVRA
jgi:hopene-associated glycosyltransferase HpnB